MIKFILKKIIPIKILKATFLILNEVKIKTWDKIFFPEKIISSNNFQIKEEKNPFLDSKIPTERFSSEIRNKLKLWIDPKWSQDQYFLHYKDNGWIEPLYGWAITETRHLIYPSLGFSRAPYVRKPNLIENYFRKKKILSRPKIISMRDTGEENYFHFFNDVLPKLFLIEDQGYHLKDFTIVITKRLFTKEFFQFFYTNTRLRDLNWHVQQNEWIHFSEAVFCKPYTHTKKYLDRAVNLIPIISKHVPRKIFLTRSKSSLRYIENMDEVKDVLQRYQFEIIDTATMKVAQQVEMFCDCQYLISIHGAGLTNIIFRQGNPLSILEIIQPSDYIPFHYIMLAHLYGYKYNIMLGEEGKLRFEGGFRVNPRQLEKMIEGMTI